MTIADIQDKIMAWGWQWEEHVFNDGISANCYVQLSKNTSPHVFASYPVDDATRKAKKDNLGWGRFRRQWAWEQAYTCIEAIEEAKQPTAPPVESTSVNTTECLGNLDLLLELDGPNQPPSSL